LLYEKEEILETLYRIHPHALVVEANYQPNYLQHIVSKHRHPVSDLLEKKVFAFAGIATGLWASNFDQMNIFSTFVITPLTYLGGVFYSIQMLPTAWQHVAKFNPILYMVDGFRYGFLGRSDISLWVSMLLVLVLALFFFVLCVHLFRKGYKLRT